MADKPGLSNLGTIVAARGSVVDIRFGAVKKIRSEIRSGKGRDGCMPL